MRFKSHLAFFVKRLFSAHAVFILLLALFSISAFFSPKAFAQSLTILNTQVNSSSDDAYHTPQGWPGYTSTDGVVTAGRRGSNGPQWGGWKFNIVIPQGATITNAYVELNQSGYGYIIPTILSFQNSAIPAAFSSTSTPYNRWQDRTLFQVEWTWGKLKPGNWIRTPDLSLGLQELVNRFNGVSSVVLLEDGSPAVAGQYHDWMSFDGNPLLSAKLHVEYTSGTDTVPPLRSNGNPTGVLPLNTTQSTLSINTNENATCKYDVIPQMSYITMTNTFTTTGGLTHSSNLLGLTNGASYTYFVKCQDTLGNVNTDDYSISFSVAAPDLTAPLRSNGAPLGSLPSGTTTATLSLNTNENATCKFSTVANTAYSAMTDIFTTTGGISHSTLVTNLSDNNSYTYYVKCQDSAGNVNPDDLLISFNVLADTIPPVRSNGAPTGNLLSGTTQTTLSLNTNENATCKYDTSSGVSYSLMANAFTTTSATSHSTLITGLADNTTYSYFVKCQDTLGNINTDDYIITFKVSAPGPIVIDKQIISSFDDAFHDPDNSPYPGFGGNSTSRGIFAGNPGNAGLATWGGWRWTGLGIPAGSTISMAYVRLNQRGYGSVFPTTLAFENSQTPQVFSLTSSPYHRWSNHTTFQTTWTWGKLTPASWIQTPSLALGIQELVNLYGALDSVVLLEDGSNVLAGQYHEWESFDTNALLSAKLHVEYTPGVGGADVTPPLISNGAPLGSLPAGTTQATLGLNTNENATCKYDISSGVSYALMANTFTTTSTTSHSTIISGLLNGNSYNYFVRCQDVAGNANISDYQISFSVANVTPTPTPVATQSAQMVPLSMNPPGGLLANQVPQFIVLGFDDNWKGLRWLPAFFAARTNPNGSPMHVTFNMIGADVGVKYQASEVRAAYDAGHEIGNHTYSHTVLDRTVSEWVTEILQGHNAIVNATGIPSSSVVGFRAPRDAYSTALFDALKQVGYLYDSSVPQGLAFIKMADGLEYNGTNSYWGGHTLENGDVVSNFYFTSGIKSYTSPGQVPNLWEMYENSLILSDGTKTDRYCDQDWYHGNPALTEDQAVAMLQNTLTLRITNNRAPLHLCMHGQDYEDANGALADTYSRNILTRFIDWATATYPQVRIVSQVDLINWMKNPVPLTP